jgi:hypothetical protein
MAPVVAYLPEEVSGRIPGAVSKALLICHGVFLRISNLLLSIAPGHSRDKRTWRCLNDRCANFLKGMSIWRPAARRIG